MLKEGRGCAFRRFAAEGAVNCSHVRANHWRGRQEVGVWRAGSCGNTSKAQCAKVRVFAVLEPAIAVWGGGAADFAVGGGCGSRRVVGYF